MVISTVIILFFLLISGTSAENSIDGINSNLADDILNNNDNINDITKNNNISTDIIVDLRNESNNVNGDVGSNKTINTAINTSNNTNNTVTGDNGNEINYNACISSIFSTSTYTYERVYVIMAAATTTSKTINIQEASYYGANFNPGIQNIINSANNGDTIKFLGKNYNGLYLIINKALNIISTVGTTITASGNNIIFTITASGAGTTISGFNLISNNNNAILLDKTSKVVIKNNNISSSSSSLSVTAIGIKFNQSANCNITNNIIKNLYNGISVYDSDKILISANEIKGNDNFGLYLYNVRNSVIRNNTITDNHNVGINTEGTITTVSIIGNTIKKNGNGIRINSVTNLLKVTENTIIGNVARSTNHPSDYDTGYGILFGKDYTPGGSNPLDISINAIYDNSKMEVYFKEASYDMVYIGANWYGSSNVANLCGQVSTSLITSKLLKDGAGRYYIGFFIGDTLVTNIPSIQVTFKLNNGETIVVNSLNGIAKVDYNELLKGLINQDNLVSAKVGYDSLKKTLSSQELIDDYDNERNNQGSGGESAGNGSGNGNGDGNLTGSGGNGNGGSGTGDSGNMGNLINTIATAISSSMSSVGSSSADIIPSKSSQYQEILIDDNTEFENSSMAVYIISIISIFTVVLYYRQDFTKILTKLIHRTIL
ncbi:MAG: right-handed parallel beta-helix repeat-containing protein [Methanobacteriaceae archaeon]